jgi:hypothetical protein
MTDGLKFDAAVWAKLIQYNKKRLKWVGNLNSLKKFISDSIGLEGKWQSPGGYAKHFICGNMGLVFTWYANKQNLLIFSGKDGTIY